MAALSITAANVAYVSGPLLEDGVAGEAFAAGACVYLSDAGTWLKAQSDGTAVQAGANNLGMALATADAAGARVTIALPGAIVSVGTGTPGTPYMPSDTAGSYDLFSDHGSTDKITLAALGIGSNQLLLCRVYNAGAVIA